MATKSFSIKIGADTSEFLKELKKVDKSIKETEKDANELQKGLKMQFDSNRFTQAQKQAQAALEQTNLKIESINKELKYLQETGGMDTSGFQKLQTELAKAENQAIKLKAQIQELNKLKLESITKGIDSLSDNLGKAASQTKALSAAAVGAIAGIYKLTQDARELGDTISTNAVEYGMSTEAIQKWEYVAMQSDVEATTLYNSFRKLNSALGDQLLGNTSQATTALEKLGIVGSEFKTTDEAFEAVIEKISNLKSVTEQTAYATDIFGERYASALIPLFQSGTASIKDYINEFKEVGYLSDDEVKSLSVLDNELNKVQKQFELAKTQLGEALLPMLQTMVQFMTTNLLPILKSITDKFNNMDKGTQNFILTVLTFTATLSPLLMIGSKLLKGISLVIKVVPVLITSLNTLQTSVSGVYLGVASLVGALGLGLNILTNWENLDAVQVALMGLAGAFMAAAAAVATFHASASVGLAVGGIVAGIATVAAVIKGIQSDWKIGTSSVSSGSGLTSNLANSYNVDTNQLPSSYSTDNSQVDNSTNTYNISINANDYASAEEVANALAIKLQSRR